MLPFAFQTLARAVIFAAAFCAWVTPELTEVVFRRPPAQAASRDRGTFPLLVIVMALSFLAAFFAAFSAPLDPALAAGAAIARAPAAARGVFALGILLILAGTALRRYAIHVLGRYFTRAVLTQPGQALVQRGPYRWIRHPSYAAMTLSIAGIGLALGSWLSLGLLLAGWLAAILRRIHVEEQALAQALGEPYRQYMKRTRRMIPWVW